MKRSLFTCPEEDPGFVPNWRFIKDFQLANLKEPLNYFNFKKKLAWVESTGNRSPNFEGLQKSETGSSNANHISTN